ncbi:MAG: cytochrome b/b6 domain-containing protein [Hyphomicrobiaceae bacterium]
MPEPEVTASGRSDGPTGRNQRERVWDGPVRLFHWALAVCVITAWYLGYFRSFTTIGWHFYLGYAVAGLLMFRLVWGFIGSPSSRLSALIWPPRKVLAYAGAIGGRTPSNFPGHSPLGSLSVIAMLASLTVQVATGLCASDDALFSSGPLSEYFSSSTVITLTAVHHFNSRILLGLIILHILAIAYYLIWKRENLIVAMITGWKTVSREHDRT